MISPKGREMYHLPALVLQVHYASLKHAKDNKRRKHCCPPPPGGTRERERERERERKRERERERKRDRERNNKKKEDRGGWVPLRDLWDHPFNTPPQPSHSVKQSSLDGALRGEVRG